MEYKTPHLPTTNSTLCRSPHLNNKQNKNTNPIISRQNYHLTQPCPSEEKQTNKNSAQISPYTKLIQTTGPTLGGQKAKRRKNSTLNPGKRRPHTQYISKIYKQLLQLNSRKINDPIKKWAKELNRHFSKEDIRWLTNT